LKKSFLEEGFFCMAKQVREGNPCKNIKECMLLQTIIDENFVVPYMYGLLYAVYY
jgi:hypothetical protein